MLQSRKLIIEVELERITLPKLYNKPIYLSIFLQMDIFIILDNFWKCVIPSIAAYVRFRINWIKKINDIPAKIMKYIN